MSTTTLPMPANFLEDLDRSRPAVDLPADPIEAFYIDGEGAHRRVGDDRFGPRTSHLNGLTATIHYLVAKAGADGLTMVEIRARLCAALGRELGPRSSHVLKTTVKNQQLLGHLAFHYQVGQTTIGTWGPTHFEALQVFTLPSQAPARTLYAGFQLPAVPRCFRGPIDPTTLHPAAAKTFLVSFQGPILSSPAVAEIRRRAAPVDILLNIGGSPIQRPYAQRGIRAFPTRH